MESLDSLKSQKRQLEYELEKISIKSHHSTPWRPGVQDQYKSESYTLTDYTDQTKAIKLISEIEELNHKIETYAQRARQEREMQEFLRDSQIPKYSFERAGGKETTTNPALAARYDAQHRFFGMSKLKQTIAKLNGQYRKFSKLWDKANTQSKVKQQEYAEQLSKLFR